MKREEFNVVLPTIFPTRPTSAALFALQQGLASLKAVAPQELATGAIRIMGRFCWPGLSTLVEVDG